MTLYILTLHYNQKDKLTRLKNSLLSALKNIDFKWLIKDNGSDDKSFEEIQSWDNPNIIGFDYKHNKDTYSKGINFLFKETTVKTKDLILTLNNDIVFNDTSSLQKMIDIIEGDESVGQVGSKLNYVDSNKIQHNGVLISNYKTPFNYRSGQNEEERDRKNRIFPMITGAVSLMRAEEFIPLNEEYIWAFEDTDQSMRVGAELKKKVVCCGETNISHEESVSLKKNPVNRLFLNQNVNTFRKYWGNHLESLQKMTFHYMRDEQFNLYKKK